MKKIIFIFILLFSSLSFAEGKQQKTINILTWWGYLDHPEIISSVEKACNIKISYDQYYSNDEFLRRWRTQKNSYDIIIFSNTIYKIIQDEIPNIRSSKLSREAKLYNPVIRRHYLNRKLPNNIIYYAHSMPGFIYNPKLIQLSASDSISTIFQKANNKIIVIMDDPVEANELLSMLFNINSINSVTQAHLNKISPRIVIYLGNEFNQTYKDPNFAFTYRWSGEAFNDIHNSGMNLRFFIHPQLSYVSTDLLAQTSNTEQSSCAAQMLRSKKALSIIENNHYYFTPYTDIKNINNDKFKNAYKEFIALLPKLKWIEPATPDNFDKINNSWEFIKSNLANREIQQNIENKDTSI